MTRMRSPNYPSLSLKQSIDMVAKIHRANRTNVITREDAAQAMGYSGLTGRSMTVLASLSHFGLLSRVGTGDVKVTQTAVEILYAENERERNSALLKAAYTPHLFRAIHERFPEGIPSENAIRSFLIKQEFSDSAVGPAISAFMATYREVEHLKENEDNGSEEDVAPELLDGVKDASSQQQTSIPVLRPVPQAILGHFSPPAAFANNVPDLNKVDMNIKGDKVYISGLFDLKGLGLLEKRVIALKALLALQSDDDGFDMDNINQS